MSHDSLTAEETTLNTYKTQQLTTTLTGTLISAPPLPTLPFDIIAEILCRLPVKLLLQLQCLCKSFNSLISDPKFAKKHLCLSTKFHHHHHLMVSIINISREFFLYESTIPSIFSTSRVKQAQLSYPSCFTTNIFRAPVGVCSCDGIFCFTVSHSYAVLWNPSIRKFKMLPPLENPRKSSPISLYI
jgi:hypothetical protein